MRVRIRRNGEASRTGQCWPVLFAALACLAAAPAPGAPDKDPLAGIGSPTPTASGWQDIHVQVVARVAANLGAPMSGRLIEFPLRDGDRFDNGQLLARFDCGEQEGALAKAKALLREKREVLSTNSKLHSLGTSSGLEYQVAAAQVEEANADVQTVTAQVSHCMVKAPFAGRVASVTERAFQFVNLGAPLMEILDDRNLDLELIVPSRWLTWLTIGTKFTVSIDETATTYDAVVDRLAGKVDAVSQSIKLFGKLTRPSPQLLAGMSGRAMFERPQK